MDETHPTPLARVRRELHEIWTSHTSDVMATLLSVVGALGVALFQWYGALVPLAVGLAKIGLNERRRRTTSGTNGIMVTVGHEWSLCWQAARGGNIELALYAARRVRSLLHALAVIRPLYAPRLRAFERDHLSVVLAALEVGDRTAFERAFTDATARANGDHAELGFPFIRWRMPAQPQTDLDLTPTTRTALGATGRRAGP